MIKRTLAIFAVVTLVSAALAVSTVLAESTLDQVLKRGEVIVGIGMNFPPWGFYDKDGKAAGFDVSYAEELAKALKVKLQIVPAEGMNRIPYLVSGKIDVAIATFTMTLERCQTIAFTIPYAVQNLVFVTKKGSGIKSLQDLKGKRVSTSKGTTEETILDEQAPKGTIVDRYNSDNESYLALRQGKADACIMDYILAVELMKKYPNFEVAQTLRTDLMSLGCRRGDIEWLNWLNWFVLHMNLRGTSQAYHEKWFGTPQPKLQVDF
jgi:polar amino acid transport system substrate-binding protein